MALGFACAIIPLYSILRHCGLVHHWFFHRSLYRLFTNTSITGESGSAIGAMEFAARELINLWIPACRAFWIIHIILFVYFLTGLTE